MKEQIQVLPTAGRADARLLKVGFAFHRCLFVRVRLLLWTTQ